MMFKAALLVACVVVAVFAQEKQSMVGGMYPGMGTGMQMCGTQYCQMGQMCSYQYGYPQCVMNTGGMYPGTGNGMYPGTGNGIYPGTGNGMYPGMGNGMYPGMGNGMYPGMAMTEEENPATAPKAPVSTDQGEEQTPPVDITESL